MAELLLLFPESLFVLFVPLSELSAAAGGFLLLLSISLLAALRAEEHDEEKDEHEKDTDSLSQLAIRIGRRPSPEICARQSELN